MERNQVLGHVRRVDGVVVHLARVVLGERGHVFAAALQGDAGCQPLRESCI